MVKESMSMTGIDYFSAMMIASEIGDITRFRTPEKLVSWSGLCPSIHQSGKRFSKDSTGFADRIVMKSRRSPTAVSAPSSCNCELRSLFF